MKICISCKCKSQPCLPASKVIEGRGGGHTADSNNVGILVHATILRSIL